MISRFDDFYKLDTAATSYVMRVTPTGHLEHVYYGPLVKALGASDLVPLCEKRGAMPGNASGYKGLSDELDDSFCLENFKSEFACMGKGDLSETAIEIEHGDGSHTSDFVFDSALIMDKKPEYKSMPTAYGIKGANVLCVILKDKSAGLTVRLYYCVFEECNVISRMTILDNTSDSEVLVKRIMSNELDLTGTGYTFTTFNGAWVREMHRHDTNVNSGKHVNESFTGTSSSRANPFTMISRGAGEDSGVVYGLNLIYSGNHYECLEATPYGKSRFVSGISPRLFSYRLAPGSSFEAPEAVMTVSLQGFNGMSLNMHHFVSDHIVRGSWQYKERPVLLNSWEACYFNINESRLLGLAKEAADAGMELFVMDDGWFGERNDDTSSLGDWEVNTKKLPGGIGQLAAKVNSLGIDFGIWVEPEMVNKNSRLYEAHPDWAISIPDRPHSEGRNQMLLDLTRPEVREYIIDSMRKVFSSGNISYVKWDMNRCFTDVYSRALPADRQGEVLHGYVCGFYEIARTLTEEFPDILFEGCASGGNRFDLGALSYFPQIWASDDTDALERSYIQTGYSYGYPQSTYTCHVSGVPNHQTLRRTPLESRFNVAACGVLGYEFNLKEMDKKELAAVRGQVAYYKEHRKLLQFGDFYRGSSLSGLRYGQSYSPEGMGEGNSLEWTIVSADKSEAMHMVLQDRAIPNMGTQMIHLAGLDGDKRYRLTHRTLKYNVKDFGNLINAVSPVHVKEDSLMHNAIDRFYKLDGEDDSCEAYGAAFMAGIYTTQNFVGTGFNDKIRYYQDLGSRLYYLKSKEV